MECTTIRARVLAETEVVRTNPYGVVEISDGSYEQGYTAGYEQALIMPRLYVDIDFTENGRVYDKMNNSSVGYSLSPHGKIKNTTVYHKGNEYIVPAFTVSGLSSTLATDYIQGVLNVDNYDDYFALFKHGLTVETFFQNTSPDGNQYKYNSVVFGNNNGSGWAIILNSTQVSANYNGGVRFIVSTGKDDNKAYLSVINTTDEYGNKKIYPVYKELTHVVCVYDYVESTNTATVSMYVNGVLAGTFKEQTRGYMFNYPKGQYRGFGIGTNITGNANTTYPSAGNQQCTDLIVVDAKMYAGAATAQNVESMYNEAVKALGKSR